MVGKLINSISLLSKYALHILDSGLCLWITGLDL